MSSVALFLTCVLATVGIGLAVSYSSGILNGTADINGLPFALPRWLAIAIPPVLFFHLGLALFFVLREPVYTESARMVRGWTWAFWIAVFIETAITPFFVYYGMPVAAFVMAAVGTALAAGTTILTYRRTVVGGAVMTIFFIAALLITIYLGYWAF